MRSAKFSILASTAVALVLSTAATVKAQPALPTAIEATVPFPESANVPPPTARDIGVTGRLPQPQGLGPTDGSIRGRISVPPAANAPAQPRRNFASPNAPHGAPATPGIIIIEPEVAPVRRELARPEVAPGSREPARPEVAPASREPARPAVSTATLAIPDAEITEKLRELIARKQLDRLVSRKPERDAIAALYQNNRGLAPLWVANGGPSDRAKAAIAHLRGIEADALDPGDYPMPNLSATSAEAQAEAELKFTATLLTYARHVLTGRVHFSRVSLNIDYKDAFDPADVLNKLAAASDVARTLESLHPQQAAYKSLKTKYAELRRQSGETGPARIPNGQVLKYMRDKKGQETFMLDPRVPQLRERLGLPGADDTRYDRSLVDAVAKFQKQNGIATNGQLTPATVEALNGPNREKRLQSIAATMERWRWMPRDLGRTHVMLNIPDYHLRVMNNGSQVWMTRVVVGKPSQATPLITETMKFITVNPTWNVPQSIIYNELLPLYETSDPQIFDRMGLKVERNSNGEIRVYQPPGERNALGRIRFNFPNKFLVYQHDTPEKHYFAHDKRAYSHGCMRVQDPLKYAEVMLSLAAPKSNHTQDTIRRMFGGEERQIDFTNHIPVHITYQTAFVDDAGQLQFREDIYGLDARLQAQLKGSERAVADISLERPADPNFKPTPNHVQRMHSAARGGSPFALFEQLFR